MYVTAFRSFRLMLGAATLAAMTSTTAGAQTGTAQLHRQLAALDAERSALSLERLSTLGDLGALAGLQSLRSLEGLRPLAGLDASLAGLRGLEGLSAIVDVLPNSDVGIRRRHGDDQPSTDSFERYRGGDEQAADSLFRKAREAMTNGDYRRAAVLFRQIVSKYPQTRYAGDALYFRAFSLYRAGDTGDLRSALGDLETLSNKYASSSTQGDARTLRVRICGELARRGDERCTAEVEAVGSGASSGSGGSASSGSSSSSSSRSSSSRAQASGCPSEDDDDDERIAALNALLQMDSERALPILERVLARRDACSVALRRKAIFLVSQKGNSRAADILLNVAKTDPDKEVRGQALFWLGQTRDDRAVGMLEDVLKSSDDKELQDKAIFGLSQHHSERAQTVLRNIALNESMGEETREQAIFWLGQQQGGVNASFLRELYDRVKSDKLKEKIIFSASQQRSTENASWLLSVAQNDKEDIELRKNALFWAGQSKMISFAELGTMYAKLNDREMKEQVIFVLSQRRDGEAVDKLLDIAKNEKDRDLRKKAIFWLSQSKDPRIVKFLEDLISK
ncbi:MAG: HEAT repeat domain-containing protein [Gemmatimonadaceae bacterium]